MQGWISVHRKVTGSWLWEDRPFSFGQSWIDLLLMANHKDKKFPLGQEIIDVQRGSFITSELKLMNRWGWSKSKVRRFLTLLENDSMIVKKSDRKKTTLTICNYSDYQDTETTEEPLKDHKRTIKRPLKDTNNNDNNVNNDNNENNDNTICENLWTLYPKKDGKVAFLKKMPALIKLHTVEQMKRTIERYADHSKGKDNQYILNGGTFVNGRYEDYLDANYKGQSKDTGNPFKNALAKEIEDEQKRNNSTNGGNKDSLPKLLP